MLRISGMASWSEQLPHNRITGKLIIVYQLAEDGRKMQAGVSSQRVGLYGA